MTFVTVKDRALKNISYSLLSFVFVIVTAIVVTPIVVHHFGVKEYGIYIFISTMVSLAGLLDVGFSVAISKLISEKYGRKDIEGLKDLFKTANTILLLIGIVGATGIIGSIFIGLTLFPSEMIYSYEKYIPAFIYAGILFLITSVSGLYTIIPSAYQRFDIKFKVGVPFFVIQQVAILVVIFLDLSINILFLTQAVLAYIFYFIYKKYTLSILNKEERVCVGVYGWNKNDAIKCYKFGVVSFFNDLAGSSLLYLDRMIIPLFLGPSNLAFYSLPGSITNKIPSLSNTLSSVVFPMASHFSGEGNMEITKVLYTRSMRLITIVSTAITITFIAFAHQMLQYWISVEVADKSTNVLIILAITNLIIAIVNPLSNFLLGVGRLKSLTVTSVVTALLNAVLLIVLLPRFGIEGAAWAYLLAFIPFVYLLYETEHSYLELTLRKYHYLKLFSRLTVMSVIIFLMDIYFIKPFISSFFVVIVSSIFSCVMFVYMYYLFGFFEKEDSRDILNFIKQAIISIKSRFKNKYVK